MKIKAIMSLMLVAAMALGATIAMAETFTANPLSGSIASWTTNNGGFEPSGSGVISTYTGVASRAEHPVTTDASGAFSFESTFKLNNASTDVHVGVGSGSDDITVGWCHNYGFFAAVKNNGQILGTMGASLDPSKTYTGKITSTDGKNFECSIYDGSNLVGKTTVLTGFKPSSVVVWIENYGVPVGGGPIIYSVNYQSEAAASPSPSPTGSPSPTTAASGGFPADLQAKRDYYARQPSLPMSDQSIIYNPDGTIKQVITGNKTTTPTASPNATASLNVTVTPSPSPSAANVTASPTIEASLPSATKTQSPGFEIILATIGMISALVLITRKKK